MTTMISPHDELTIGELAARSGVAPSALRYYESLGMIRSLRTAAGHRRYQRGVIRRVAFIVFAQRIGLSLDEIREELGKLSPQCAPTKADWNRLTGNWKRRIDQSIAEMQVLRDSLNDCIGCGCLTLERCRLANPQDKAAKNGAGPRYWLGDKSPVK
ncbi:redox-sensitive transcriptional activator SoxR [Permianibacter aggregans]|uniref:Redox-sensitive transcriptional activator SoxR n=1 Tax=Permianibacter aggregans TaxID=1510150 RepID=A0A4V3D7A3_9GAMM|nr:redox-sensitive transcriptional activator SoxR [Permianibacter aggregans]QGX39770.1 redox-sensitive transcriptional activator SoxR [Permianibacter aggregans]TDQ47107.1 MerR family redox-sensitive transcriptional activator SoxR [Permianibacter aggregans]